MVATASDVEGRAGGDTLPSPSRGLLPGEGPRAVERKMTGPGARAIARDGPHGTGIFGGSHRPEADPPGNGPSASRGGRRRGVVVLLPALNEEQSVGAVIDRIPTDALRRSGYEVGVWVVDGKSTDATLEVARNRGANVFVQRGDGKGNGVRQAVDYLLAGDAGDRRVFVMLDADGSYPPERIPEFVRAVEAGTDVVLGSRFLGTAEDGAITSLNRLGNRALSGLATMLFGVPVTDVCTGMWAFSEDTLRNLGLAANGFDLEADLFASSCEAGARVRELPVDYACRIGEPKLVPIRSGLLIAWRLLMKRLNRPGGPDAPPPAGAEAPFAEDPA